jgi:hypothetical protein
MSREKDNQREVERLLGDQDFSRRTAVAVMQRAVPQQKYTSYWAAAAVALIAAGTLWFSRGGIKTDSYAGLSETSATAIVSETQNAWETTDLVINTSLSH